MLVVLAAAIAGFFIVQNILRGGAASPEEAAQKIASSINGKDLVSLYGMIAPRERDAVMRVTDQVQKTFKDQGIAEAIAKTTSEAPVDSELSLDGVDISVSGAPPVVTKISDDYALVRYGSGEITMTVRPQETKGVLRAGFESNGNMEVIQETQFIAELGPNKTGITLVASKSGGRWYVSPMLSALDAAGAWSQYADSNESGDFRGYLPDEFSPGGSNPETAAANGVSALVDAVTQGDPRLLAPALAKDEATALYLYGGLWNSSGASYGAPQLTLGDVNFTAGPVMGNRAHAIAKNVSLGSDGGRAVITEKCIEDSQNTQTCLNGSGFFDVDGSGMENAMSVASIDGKFGLTTVKEDGVWKVSLLDTTADMASSWLKSLTPEQTLVFLGMERTTASGGELQLGATSSVEFNSAGYAVRTMNLDERQKVVLRSDETLTVSVHAEGAGGKLTQDDFRCNLSRDYAGCELDPGRYVLVLDAKPSGSWANGFREGGNGFTMSADVAIERHVDPPLIDGSTEGRQVSFGYGLENVRVEIPEKTNKKLFLEFPDGVTVPGPVTFTVGDENWNTEGDREFTVDGRKASRPEIPLPMEAGGFTLTIAPAEGDMDAWWGVDPRLFFADE